MNIVGIRVKNYKSFLDSGKIPVDKKLFSLIGQNNTGKSAIMDAVQCVFPSSKKSVSVLDFHKGTDDEISIEIWFDGVNETYLEEKIYGDKILKQLEKVRNIQAGLGENPTQSKIKKLDAEKEKIEKIRSENYDAYTAKYNIKDEKFYVRLVSKKGKNVYKKFYIDNEIEITEGDLKALLPQLKVIPAIRDPKNESTAGSNSYLKELIQMLDDEIQTSIKIEGNNITYKELNKVIAEETKARCKSIGESVTQFYNQAIGTEEYIVIIDSDVNISKGTTYTTKIRDINTGIESDILNCGTGYQSMIILSILETYVKISQKNSDYILLIEEPEVYLHPKLQRKMIDTLVTISNKNQIIFTSHSPITVSKLSKDQIRLVKKVNGVAKVENIIPKIVINELGIKSDDILTNKGIIFVEGKDDKNIIELLLNKIEYGISDKINIIDAGNCENLKFYANAEILINNNFDIPTLIIRDTDTKDPSKRKEELIKEITSHRNNGLPSEVERKINKSIVILERYSLEGYFIDEKLLSILDIEPSDIKIAIQCYECQYNYYSKRVYENELDGKILSSWHQPKYFLEKFIDKFKSSQLELIEAHNFRYENQWKKFEKCKSCKHSKIDTCINVRAKINDEIKSLKLAKKDFIIESIKDKNIDEIKETKLKIIVEILEDFITYINKQYNL